MELQSIPKVRKLATATSTAEHELVARGEHVHEPKWGKPDAR